eukprot:CAMPEP_0168459078 /NCGR_PEP_ID=MMETSP0228-20121227/52722_1 /TAXON_ID=133427 /ORGANISM="Protoceratium reticulatum, Strain CCCM 535 (=CCMP 1889)" /LENGTH=63 /DNA_ID=CAMNT_0008474227 /DNA_START=35 /DNA_END=223 /DNA_ORIENTATION=+
MDTTCDQQQGRAKNAGTACRKSSAAHNADSGQQGKPCQKNCGQLYDCPVNDRSTVQLYRLARQ